MNKRFSIWVFFIAVFLIPLSIFGLVNWYEKNKGSLPVLGPVENEKEHQVGNFELADQDGKKFSDAQLKGKIVVANFFFTHCPVICPKMTNNLKMVQEKYGKDDEVMISSFTVDPERDSSSTLRKYAGKYGIDTEKWVLVTGDKKEIYKLARNSFRVAATDGDGGPDDFIHSEKLVLVDHQMRIRGYYSGTESSEVKQLLKDIKKLKHEN